MQRQMLRRGRNPEFRLARNDHRDASPTSDATEVQTDCIHVLLSIVLFAQAMDEDLPSDSSLPSQTSLPSDGEGMVAPAVPGDMSSDGDHVEVVSLPSDSELSDCEGQAEFGKLPCWSRKCCSACCFSKFRDVEHRLCEWWEHRSSLSNDAVTDIVWRMLQEAQRHGAMWGPIDRSSGRGGVEGLVGLVDWPVGLFVMVVAC